MISSDPVIRQISIRLITLKFGATLAADQDRRFDVIDLQAESIKAMFHLLVNLLRGLVLWVPYQSHFPNRNPID
jgi:hypothetical protein